MESYNKELCEERHHRTNEALERHEMKIENLEKCTRKLEPMVENRELICSESRKRLKKIERRPAEIFIKTVTYAASIIAGALASLLIQYFEF